VQPHEFISEAISFYGYVSTFTIFHGVLKEPAARRRKNAGSASYISLYPACSHAYQKIDENMDPGEEKAR